MNQWQEFLQKQALLDAQAADSVSPLNDTGLLYIGGDDATEFLQNQLSNDISHISAKQAQLSSFSNAKGRMIAIMRVIQIDGGYLLVMPHSIVDDVMQRLQKYVIRSQVVIADITESFARIGVSMSDNQHIEEEHFPQQINQVYQSDSLISVRVHGSDNQKRFLMLSNDEDEAIKLFTSLSENLSSSVPDSWRLQEIAAGVPNLYPQTQESFVLQMSNLQLIDGVSFKKGCYPGQEVVARMQYLGKLKRRMFLANINTDNCPAAGDEMKTRSAAKNDGVGKVVDAIQIAPKSCQMLFIAQIPKVEANELILANQPDAEINLQELPYPYPD